jgi:hypothetical protein
MKTLASQWKPLVIVIVAAVVAMAVAEPDYNKLQIANSADDFRAILGDHDSRALIAASCDLFLAAGYGLLGIVVFRKLATGKVALLGALLAVATAVLDEIENVLLIINISRADSVTDGAINAMTTVGVVKWSFAAAAVLMLIVLAVRAWTSRQGSGQRA